MKRFCNMVDINVTLILLFPILLLFGIYYFAEKAVFLSSLLPVSFGTTTLIFSFLAYKHTKDKFRLELLNKRLEVYENLVNYLSGVMTLGGMYEKGNIQKDLIDYAHGSFRGHGFHNASFLFGDDIKIHLKEINIAYAYLSANQSSLGKEKADKWANNITIIENKLKNLPDIFSPYLNFSNYCK